MGFYLKPDIENEYLVFQEGTIQKIGRIILNDRQDHKFSAKIYNGDIIGDYQTSILAGKAILKRWRELTR